MDNFEKQHARIMRLAFILPILYVVGGLIACGFAAWVCLSVMAHFGII